MTTIRYCLGGVIGLLVALTVQTQGEGRVTASLDEYRDCETLTLQRFDETAQQAIDRMPDGGCLIFGSWPQPIISPLLYRLSERGNRYYGGRFYIR